MVMEKNETVTLGEKIRALRVEKGLPLRKLAIDIDVTAGYLSDVENGNRHPRPELVEKIAEVLKANAEELKSYDGHVDLETRRWTEKHPLVGVMLRRLREAENPEQLAMEVLKKLKERAR
jgi:DNA-binding XRE family transcriptional regulator